MKDVNKTQVKRDNSKRRMRRRKRNMSLYTFIVVMLVLIAGVTVSYTFLFNISEIRVKGESDRYTAEEIVAASGISKGDNLLRLNVKKSEQRILDELLYVETAVVDRDFPSSLEITVTKCVPTFNVQYDGGFLLVSTQGKILSDNGFVTQGLPIFYGFEPKDTTAGRPLESVDEQKTGVFSELIRRMNDRDKEIISSIDMTDKHDIVVNYENGIIFKMGNWTDISYKLNMAETVMEKDDIKGKKGYITMIGSNQCSFRTSDVPISGNSGQQPVSQPATDTNGMPLATAQVIGTDSESTSTETVTQTVTNGRPGSAVGEINDEEEALFREHNEALITTSAAETTVE